MVVKADITAVRAAVLGAAPDLLLWVVCLTDPADDVAHLLLLGVNLQRPHQCRLVLRLRPQQLVIANLGNPHVLWHLALGPQKPLGWLNDIVAGLCRLCLGGLLSSRRTLRHKRHLVVPLVLEEAPPAAVRLLEIPRRNPLDNLRPVAERVLDGFVLAVVRKQLRNGNEGGPLLLRRPRIGNLVSGAWHFLLERFESSLDSPRDLKKGSN